MKLSKKKSARTIAPRLADGRCRVNFGSRMPEGIKEGLRKIARTEARSMSWVVEEVIIRYFHMKRPEYAKRLKNG
jgi:hypothetical protein